MRLVAVGGKLLSHVPDGHASAGFEEQISQCEPDRTEQSRTEKRGAETRTRQRVGRIPDQPLCSGDARDFQGTIDL